MKSLRSWLGHSLEELYVALWGWVPTPLGMAMRLLCWRPCFRHCGTVRFGTGVTLINMKAMSLGDGCRVGRLCFLTATRGSLTLGNDVALSPCVHVSADEGSITVGDHVAIGPGTVLRAANHCFRRRDCPIMTQGHEAGEIVIESDVWIGANCVVLPDVRIGRGAIVGAGAVVTHSVPPFSIVAGVPARPIGQRPEGE